MSQDEYAVPTGDCRAEEEIKKSRFITLLRHTRGLEAAKAFVAETRRQHPQARHHCWACVAAAPDDGQAYGFSDDGEPAGTAGKPMLAQLQGSGLGEVTVVVVRYYGGIKLGTGGLVRAYGGGVSSVLKSVPRKLVRPMANVEIGCGYEDLDLVQWLVSQQGGVIQQSDYGEQIRLICVCEKKGVAELERLLTLRSQGRIRMSVATAAGNNTHNNQP